MAVYTFVIRDKDSDEVLGGSGDTYSDRDEAQDAGNEYLQNMGAEASNAYVQVRSE